MAAFAPWMRTLYFAPASVDDRRRVAGEEEHALRFDRGDPVRHESLVEVAEIELRSEARRVVRAQLDDGALAEKVAAVGRIVRGTLGLAFRRGGATYASVSKQRCASASVRDGPPARRRSARSYRSWSRKSALLLELRDLCRDRGRRKIVEEVVVGVNAVSGGDRRMTSRKIVEIPVDKSGERVGRRRCGPTRREDDQARSDGRGGQGTRAGDAHDPMALGTVNCGGPTIRVATDGGDA